MKFTHVLGECCSKEWASDKLISEDGLAYWIIISILNLAEVTGEALFCSSVSIVIPSLAKDSAQKFAREDAALEIEEAAMIWEYGARADVWNQTNDNPLVALCEAVKEANKIPFDFEEYMYKPLNRLGWNGWKFVTF